MEDEEKKDEDMKDKKEKKRIKYPPPEDGSFIIKDSCPQFREVTYPEPKGGETMIKRDLDTHRVQLKQIRDVPNIKLSVPEDVAKFVREMGDYDRERFKVIYLDNKNRVIGVENISEGTLNAALIHPREAVKGAVLANAAGVMLIHNHPSGIPQPSTEDDSIRTKLTEGFRLLGIDVIDVLIIGKEGYYSYKEAGRMPGTGIGGIERVMETDKVVEKKADEKCDIAMRAAMSTIKDYCGEDLTDIDIGGMKINVLAPETVMQVRDEPGLSHDQRVKAIQESTWAQNEAAGLCTKLLGLSPDQKEYAECIQRVSRKLAEGMVGDETKRRLDQERRELRISAEKIWDGKP